MYYDMSGFDYGILDVVQVLHLRKRRGNYYDCPFVERRMETEYQCGKECIPVQPL